MTPNPRDEGHTPSDSSKLTSSALAVKSPKPESRRHKWVRRLVIGSAAMLVGAMLGAYGVYRSIRWIPNFYAQKLTVSENDLTEDGQQMQKIVEELHDEAQAEGHWEATFSEDEINGWLAVDLQKKFPRMLPRQVHQPRVTLSSGLSRIACQYNSSDLQVVLSMDVDVYMSDEPNVVAVRIKRARIGAVPGLMQMAMGHITNAAVRARIPLRWTEDDGDPLALVTIPNDIVLDGHRVQIEEVRIDDGELRIAGRSESKTDRDEPVKVSLAQLGR